MLQGWSNGCRPYLRYHYPVLPGWGGKIEGIIKKIKKNIQKLGNLRLANLDSNFELLRTSKTRYKNSSFRTRTKFGPIPSLIPHPISPAFSFSHPHFPIFSFPPRNRTEIIYWLRIRGQQHFPSFHFNRDL